MTDLDDRALIVETNFELVGRRTLGELSPFFEAISDGRLLATRCEQTGRAWFPPRPICPDHGVRTEWFELAGSGRVRSATRSHVKPPDSRFEAPYTLAIIDLDGVEGSITHRILGDRCPEPGAEVRVVPVDDAGPHPLTGIAFELEGDLE